MGRVRSALLSAVVGLALSACSGTQGVPTVGSTPVPSDQPVAGGRVPGDVLSSDQAVVAVIAVSAMIPGREATATIRYGTYQTCHAQVLFSDRTALALGAYASGLGQTPTWRWEVPPGAPTTGIFAVACGIDLFHVPFTAAGGTSVPVAPASLRATAVPWPTPLSCATTLKGCQ